MSNSLRITGMATGMDTDTNVKKMMKPYQMRFDKLKQDKQVMQWRQEIYRDIIKDLRDLRNNYLAINSPDSTNMMKSIAYSGSTVTAYKDGVAKDGVITATALPGAANGDYAVAVKQVAEGAKITGTGKNLTLNTKLSDLGIENGKTLSVKLNEGTATLTLDNTKTVQDLINSMYNTKIGTTDTTLYGKIKINFSELTGNIIIETRETGSGKTLSLEGSDSSTLEKLGLNVAATDGKDAIIKITPPGSSVATEVTKASNSFTIDNMTYNLNSSYKVADKVNGDTLTLTAKPDSKASVEKIKGFVEKYNSIVEKMYERYSEKKQYKYSPLTEEQKKDMKETDIKKWEESAKKGLVKNDEEISKLLTNMRKSFFDSVEGAGISLKEIGLDSYSSLEAISKPGQIKVDEAKLKNALETRGDQVMKLLSGKADSSITDTKEVYNKSGVFNRIESILNDSVIKFDGSFLKKAGFEGTLSAVKNNLTDKMRKQDELINDMERRLLERENKYYLKFAQLEKYMDKMNAQSSWFAAQMGGGK